MSPSRRIQTEVSEMDDQGGLAQTNVPESECQDGWARRLGLSSQGHSCVPSALVLRFGDGCHRRMPLRRMMETEGRDRCHRQMSQTPKVKTEEMSACVCACVCVCMRACVRACVCVCLFASVSLSLCLSVFYCDVMFIMFLDLIQSMCLLSCYLFTFC